MDILSDDIVKDGLNNLLNSAHLPIINIYDRMFKIGFSPSDDVSTLIYSIGVFIVRYNEHCKDNDIDSSIKLSYNDILENKIISKFIANKTITTIDKVAGVK